ncbi:hypothetical protein [Enterococcus pseudoavium]|uniref:hypothetical protein n=1 Tax=Enterococcus pseudoavium TaxID=44007 RepID=UPI000E251E6C|nr:hypothetical protein [Enterococcus pseudoavium]REC31243.1 hypothetical protein CF160_01760 [Enterococcus pseudoavium]
MDFAKLSIEAGGLRRKNIEEKPTLTTIGYKNSIPNVRETVYFSDFLKKSGEDGIIEKLEND